MSNWKMYRAKLLPLLLFVLCQTTLLGTILIGYAKDDLQSYYIGDIAKNSPSSNIFSFFITLCSILLGFIVYIRSHQIEELIKITNNNQHLLQFENNFSIWMGYGACLGLNVMANFQISSDLYIIHYVGGSICSIFAVFYFWLQANISYYLRSYTGSNYLAYIRYATAFSCSYFAFIALVCSCDVLRIVTNSTGNCDLISVSSEWIAIISANFYMLSFMFEFSEIKIVRPQISTNKLEM